MSSVIGELLHRADMDPPPLFADPHPCFILVQHWSVHHSRSESGFDLGERLMADLDKGGDTAAGELNAQDLA